MKITQIRSVGLLTFITLTLGLVFFACQKEISFSNQDSIENKEPTSLKVKAAMLWFKNQQSQELNSGSHFKKMQPVWEKVIVIGKVVEIPFKIDGMYILPGLTKELRNVGRQKLIIENNGERGFRSYIVSYMQTENFKGKINNINIRNFRYQKFDGLIQIYNLNKKPIKSLYFQNGRVYQNLKSTLLKTRGECNTTEWHCWEENGEWTCREVYVEIACPEDDEDDEDDESVAECDSPEPPQYCEDNGDPCSQENPPVECEGNGDPCMSAVPPPNCDGGPAGDPTVEDTDYIDGILNANKNTQVKVFISRYCNASVNNHPREAGCDYNALYELSVGQIEANRSKNCYSTVWKFVSRKEYRKPGQWN